MRSKRIANDFFSLAPRYRTKKGLSNLLRQELQDFSNELIGKKEKPVIKSQYLKLGGLTIDTDIFLKAIARNKLRAKQRRLRDKLLKTTRVKGVKR